MSVISVLWKPAWYVLDQPLTVGETASYWLIMSDSETRFATAIYDDDKEQKVVKAKVLSIHNSQLGEIIRIDTDGLCYNFFSANDEVYHVEAEETPGKIENGSTSNTYLEDADFLVELELLVDDQ